MAKATFGGMVERGWGRIVNIGSINGQAGQYGQVNYAAANLESTYKALAQEGAKGVCRAIAPGYIDTAWSPRYRRRCWKRSSRVRSGGWARPTKSRRRVPVQRGCRVRDRVDDIDQWRAAMY